MPNTYILIASATASSGSVSTFDFTSIPNTYTDLCVKLSGRGAGGYNATDTYVTFNGSTSSYSGRYFMKDSTTSAPQASTSATSKFITGFIPATQPTANVFGNLEIYIPNYASSNYKSILSDAVTENNGTIKWILTSSGVWANTAAINQVTLIANGDSFAQNSTAYLYGIKKS